MKKIFTKEGVITVPERPEWLFVLDTDEPFWAAVQRLSDEDPDTFSGAYDLDREEVSEICDYINYLERELNKKA